MGKLFRFLTKNIRKTPDFLLIGGSKCGTTTLYNYLIRHPQIAKPLVKEIHFFSHKYNRGLDWYRMYFPLKTTKKKVFEASTSYLTDEYSPVNISESIGAAKFLVLLREPLEKAVSLWNHKHPASDRYLFLESPYLNYYLSEAKYHIHIKNWFEWFEPLRFLFIKSEDLFNTRNVVFKRICDFLHIDFISLKKERKDNIRGTVVTDEIKDKFGDYFNETKLEVERLTKIKWD